MAAFDRLGRGSVAKVSRSTERHKSCKGVAMTEKRKSDPAAELHRTLNNACRKWGAREIRLRYLPKPSLNRWIAEALIDHHRVIDKIRADIPAGELTMLRGEAARTRRSAEAGHGELQ